MFKEYRVGNPVIVDDQYTHVRSIPSDNDPFYSVHGNGNALKLEDITPITMDENVLDSYKDFIKQGRLVFESNGHKVEVDIPSFSYYHDGLFLGTIEYLHELYNMLYDLLFKYHLTFFYPTPIQNND